MKWKIRRLCWGDKDLVSQGKRRYSIGKESKKGRTVEGWKNIFWIRKSAIMLKVLPIFNSRECIPSNGNV